MSDIPVHVHVFRLVKHITETPINIPIPTKRGHSALQGRQRKMERRKKKTQQLLTSIQKGLNKEEE